MLGWLIIQGRETKWVAVDGSMLWTVCVYRLAISNHKVDYGRHSNTIEKKINLLLQGFLLLNIEIEWSIK